MGFLSQKEATKIGLLFVHKYYTNLVEDINSISNLYASDASLVLNNTTHSVGSGLESYKELELSQSLFEFKNGFVTSTAVFAFGVLVNVKGILHREVKGKEVTKDLSQSFLLMKSSESNFLIVRDVFTLGEDRIVKPKKAEEKWKQKQGSHKIKTQPKDNNSKEFSYAKAAAATPNAESGEGSNVEGTENGSNEEHKYKIRVKKCTAAVTEDILKDNVSQLGPVVGVKKINTTTAIVTFADIKTVEAILARHVKERILKLNIQNKELVLEIWAEKAFHNKSRAKYK